MNCQKFESIVGELTRGRIMGVDIRRDALVHTYECSRCALRFRNEDMLTRGLNMLALETESAQAPDRIEEHLLDAFHQQKTLQPVSLVNSRFRYWLSAAAALLLFVAGVIAIRSRMQNPVVQVPQVAVRFPESKEESAPGNTPVAVDRSGRSTEPNGKYGRRGKPGRSARAFVAQTSSNENQTKPSEVVASNVRPEIATEFMPLGYLNAASLQDGGQIVRVEVPRSTMASFGLPVNMDRYNERVKADVLLGVDGVAHAIRFVQ